MDKVRLGRTELMVSRIAIGGIPIMRKSKEDAVAVVREALSLGINFIDTANAYADSEEKIGEAIRGVPREDLVLATKSRATSPDILSKNLDNSLKQLGVNHIDVYQFHNVSQQAKADAILAEGGAFEWLRNQIKAGKVRYPGFSSHNVSIALNLMQSKCFDTVQLPFNFIDREAEEAIELARMLDMGFIAMKPMGGGRLSDAGLSFRYLMQFDSIIPDPGVESKDEIREIVAVVESGDPLSEEDKTEIARLREELGEDWCHRCGYCQPCPQGIAISTALTTQSYFKRYDPVSAHALTDKAIKAARACTECRTCLSRCPYHLDIPALLKENIAFYDALRC